MYLPVLAGGPVDQIEVDVVQAEPLQAGLDGVLDGLEALIVGGQLGGDEHLGARDARRGDRAAHRGLVAVGRRGVDQPVTGLQRGGYRALGLGVRQLGDAEAQCRDRVVVVEVTVGIGTADRHVTLPVVNVNVRRPRYIPRRRSPPNQYLRGGVTASMTPADWRRRGAGAVESRVRHRRLDAEAHVPRGAIPALPRTRASSELVSERPARWSIDGQHPGRDHCGRCGHPDR